MACETPGVASDVGAAIVGESLDRFGQAIYAAKAMLDGSDHQVSDVLDGDAAGGGDVAHGFPVAAIEREGDAHLLTIVAADLECVRAPAGVAPVDQDPAIMVQLLALAAMGLEQQAVNLHDAIDAFRIRRGSRIEIMFGRLNDWRRVATRYDRCPAAFLSAVTLAATVIFWL